MAEGRRRVDTTGSCLGSATGALVEFSVPIVLTILVAVAVPITAGSSSS